NGRAAAKQFDQVTVLFTDFKGFTQMAEKLTPHELVAEIDECFRAFDEIMVRYSIEKIKTIGDAYMAAGGLPSNSTNDPADVVSAALEIRNWMLEHKKEKGEGSFEVRIGIHTGPVVAGIVGIKKFAYDIWGDTVNTAARMESSGQPGKVNISDTTFDLVHPYFDCEYRGKVEAKGKGMVKMYFAENWES
ncbi:MAG: adenylate/guanylate cyclase domain-containing protein, partial [Flavobacteriales bacterium]